MNKARYVHASSSGYWVATAISLISIQPPHVVFIPVAVISATVPNASALVRRGFQFSTFTKRQIT